MIPITKLSIGKEEIEAVKKVLLSGNIVAGKETKKAEKNIAKVFSRKHAVLTTSGTASLNITLTVLGIEKDDEVITTPFTFIATANAINYVGAKVVFADIDPITFNIDPAEVKKKITKKTKAIIAVDLFGHPFNYGALVNICRKHKLKLIEDAAQAHGAYYKEKPAGSLGDVSILSFYGSKIITSGEGGAMLTNNKYVNDKAVSHRAHGTVKNKPYHYKSIGYNFLPTDIQASILIEQFKKLKGLVKLRNKAAHTYSKNLSCVEGITLPHIEKDYKHAFLCYTIRIDPKFGNRNTILSKLNTKGIGARIYYPKPLHLQPVWKKLGYDFKKGEFPQTERACKEVISLPIYPSITTKDQDFVIKTLKTSI